MTGATLRMAKNGGGTHEEQLAVIGQDLNNITDSVARLAADLSRLEKSYGRHDGQIVLLADRLDGAVRELTAIRDDLRSDRRVAAARGSSVNVAGGPQSVGSSWTGSNQAGGDASQRISVQVFVVAVVFALLLGGGVVAAILRAFN